MATGLPRRCAPRNDDERRDFLPPQTTLVIPATKAGKYVSDPYDLAIIGGGINGCGIARDAAGRGLDVFLCEQNDLASGTSSASTKLIHGGLRYLEYYEFRLVREALMEREVLWNLAPHIVRPLRFILPHHEGLRPSWLLRLGLFLYDHIGGRKLLPATKTLDLRSDPAGKPLKAGYGKAFEYSDCWVEDARLVMLNAMDAQDRGATIKTRTRCTHAERRDGLWHVTVQDMKTGVEETIAARILINAAGPWVAKVLSGVVHGNSPSHVRLVQGSHIVVPKLFEDERCFIFQNGDGRIVFAIPYEQDFTLIGTTDRDYHDDPADVKASEEEIAYLCAAASEYFKAPVTREQVVWTYSGVRPLYDDGASDAKSATRDYVLELDDGNGKPPLLAIFGGKITTYRRLAESALEKLKSHVPERVTQVAGWTAREKLPGGQFAVDGFLAELSQLLCKYDFLTPAHGTRLLRAYGTRCREILGTAKSLKDLGHDFGGTLTEAEVKYLKRAEWALTADDILWRRSKLGLRLSKEQAAALADYLAETAPEVADLVPRT